MFKKTVIAMFIIGCSLQVFAHCEVPCGIYGDTIRFNLMYEHIETISKCIDEIKAISAEKAPDYNQLVRWVNTKEHHATEFQHVVMQYFMAQRVKAVPAADKSYDHYVKQITLLHQLIVEAMKSKQSTIHEIPENMKKMLHDFQHLYEKH